MDVLTNNVENDYGPSSSHTIDTTLPFHVKIEFHESDAEFVGYTTTLTQSNRNVVMTTGDCDYLKNMTSDITQMIIVLSNWGSDNLNWL